ncbi:probable JmjC domain-containing histone demethylation protein 2C isoform X1 [Pangasianodon hypophthalmus]|uniref:probable JmjC domain-containing histone demethylation protein 2C isoform X1 n=1 Tax=Pangasianodon hypophthalmus TaxID=310915 RepID=UPI002307A159|nr:probable JmjC domain-containing histone demethylation protein 2C isoform X1 [Pangasianodon hypophthalmus]
MELVGRRFLCVSGGEERELGGVARWGWRAGLIRAVTSRHTDSPTLAVCVEWDGEPSAECKWRRLREEWEVFVLEHELVWAKRNSTSQENSSPQPALVFQPLIGQAHVGGVAVVEFLSDRELEFYTEREELRPYEEEVDGGSSLLREDLSSHEQLQAWLRHRQLQHILQLGHSSVKGLRVKVFRPDSKPQWLHGIVSHHDHNNRTMTVLSDQVAEPLSVDPALVHVLVLDDISQLLLVEQNATTNCKPHTNKISRITLNTGNKSRNTTEADPVCSSGPVQRKQPELCREKSNCSPKEDDTDRMREESGADEARADSSKSMINHSERKRRKAGDKEEQDEMDSRSAGLKRSKGNSGSDQSEYSDSEGSILESKSLQRKSSKKPADCKTVNNPAAHLGHDLKAHSSPKSIELSSSQSAETECQRVGKVMPLQGNLTNTPCNGVYQTVNSLQCTMGLGCDKAEMERGDGVMEDQSEGASQEDCEAVSALLASQEDEQLVSLETACVLLHTSPPECEGVEGEQEIPQGEPEVRTSDLTCPEVITPSCDPAEAVEEEPRVVLTHSPAMICNSKVDAVKVVKSSQAPGLATSPRHDAAHVSEITHKTTVHQSPCSSLEVISRPPDVTEVTRLRCSASPQAARIEESSLPSKVSTDKVLIGFKSTQGSKVTPTLTLHQHNAPSPSTTDIQAQSRTPPQTIAHNHMPTADKLTKSPLIIDRNEPFTVYRDPALVRRELESLSTYVQPPHTPPNLHSKHHLKSPSPSSSSPSLTSTTSHTKIMSPAAHLSPLPLPSQSPLCSTHPSIPHPHLLPSLLPGLPPTSALLAGHARLAPLSLPHHPLALQATPSLLGQGPGTASLAPMGLYPVLWPPFPNGVHGYGLGMPGPKWTPPDTAGISEVSLRRNTPSPWVPQTSPVTSAESQGLQPPLPVQPSSAEPQRPSRSAQPSTPTSKSTEEPERRVFSETQNSTHMPLKAEQERVKAVVGKNGHASHSTVTESPSARSKQPQLVYDLTGDRTSCYQEESRRILQESIEVAPFTAKLSSDREPYPKSPTPSLHFKERERERQCDREMHMFRHSVPPRLQSAQPSPTLTQSSYYTPAAGSVENKASTRRAPPSKELYERLSSPNTAASVLSSPSTQSTVKARPPPLVKRNPEKEEGLLGKITDQLISKTISLDPLEVNSMERKGSSTSLISVSSSSSSRVVPSLHRAPIFHPPALPIVTSKEAGQGRLSPPTLTPIQPMSLSGKGQNQHRPPTLMPELRHGAVTGKRAAPEPVSITNKGYDLQRSGVLHNRERVIGGHITNGGLVNTQAATASVIVRSSGYMHTPVNHTITERSLSQVHCDHVRTFESLPSTHSKDGNGQCKRGILWTPVDTVHPVNMVTLKQDINTPLNMTKNMSTHFSNRGVKYSVNIDTPHSIIDLVSEQCEKEKEEISTIVQPKVNLSFCPPRDIPHVKKRRAGLAASELRQNMHAVQPLNTTDTLNTTKSRYTCTTHSTHTKCTAHTVDQDKESIFNPSPSKYPRLAPEVTGVVASKPGSVGKVQPLSPSTHTNHSAQSGQNNYHKLKKAWLTRHSEQDRGSVTSETAGGSTTLTTTTTFSLPIKQEVNGLEDKWPIQEGKELFLDNRKSKTLDRKCLVEDRKPNGSNAKSNTEDKKTPLTRDNKVTLEEVKPIMDRNGNLQGKKPNFQNKKLCINIRRPNSADIKIEKDNHGEKRIFQSSFESESGGDSVNENKCHKSDPGSIHRPKPAFKKKQNDQKKQRGENEREDEEEEGEEDEGKFNGTIQTTKEKSHHRLPSNGIPRSVLKDWRKVRKLKQSGEAFLQDDSCAEIGANVQKCRECRLDRSRKAQEPVISPVFCRFYYFRRLSYSKNGVVRVDGFSVVEDTDEEAVRVWVAGFEDEQEDKQREMELDTAKYILTLIGDKFCQLVKTENTAVTWVKKDTQVMWKRAVRGVREMCDACEATLFNMHWACHKCGFVVCMDCYKARERKSAKDKELYAWVRCVKNQPHDLKSLMPTQIVPERVLADLQSAMHSIRREYGIPSQCSCFGSSAFLSRSTITNGVLQLSERPQCNLKSQQQNQQKTTQNTAHKISTERRGKLECDDIETLGRKSGSPEQGSTLRDLLTSTAGKLRLGSTGPGIAFAPVYNTDQTAQKARMPSLLDDIIASVVENKIPASKMTKLRLNQNLLTEEEEELVLEEVKPIRIPLADPHTSVPHDWIGSHRLLWLKDHHHLGNQRLFKENWTQEQPVLVSGMHKRLNASLWKPEHFSREFSALHSDFYNCRDGSIINTCVKEFWDGFEDVSKRTKSTKGDPAVYRLKDWPSGEEFLALMPSRYEDIMRSLPVPEYTGPDGALNLASRLPSFFIRPDLGPRLCCAHGVTACPEQDFGTSNLHVEISDTMSILVYVGVAKGNGALSKSGVLKLLEREDLDESAKKRLRDPNETPGALWHIYLSKDLHKIQEFLQTVAVERAEADAEADSEAEWESEADPLREGSWYLSPKLRQRLLEEHGVESRTLLQFYGDTVIIPAGALHQVMNLHSCIQVNVDFVSPEHAHNSYYLTQELRPLKDQVNYEDKLQVKNIFYHSVKDAVAALSRHLKEQSTEEVKEEEC